MMKLQFVVGILLICFSAQVAFANTQVPIEARRAFTRAEPEVSADRLGKTRTLFVSGGVIAGGVLGVGSIGVGVVLGASCLNGCGSNLAIPIAIGLVVWMPLVIISGATFGASILGRHTFTSALIVTGATTLAMVGATILVFLPTSTSSQRVPSALVIPIAGVTGLVTAIVTSMSLDELARKNAE